MQVERSVTQHGGYMSLPAFRAEHRFSAMHGQCSARKAVGAFPQAALRLPAVMNISPLQGII
ncbi:MAG: hypothetical protein LBU42_08620 [Prevotellaceae bacterium]|nr:hypothetical protein [Prevotellaceae bacterium]